MERKVHNYARLLHTAVPTYPAMLAAKADLATLSAYSTRYVPPQPCHGPSPFQLLAAKQLQAAAATDEGAVFAAELLLQSQLTRDQARDALLEGLCRNLTRKSRHANGARLIGHVFRRLLASMPMRLVVILLGRLLPLLQSTAVPGVPLLQSAGRSGSGRPTATHMHTMATLAQGQDHDRPHLLSPIGCNLGHSHPQAQPPRGSSPHPNTRFPPTV